MPSVGLACAVGQCVVVSTLLILAAFFIWLVNRPSGRDELAMHGYYGLTNVDSAVLAALHSTSSSPPNGTGTIRSNLSVNLNFRNRMERTSICYREIVATAFYNGSTMLDVPDNGVPTPFCQSPGDTTVVFTAFRRTVAVYPTVAAELKREQAEGTVHVWVRVSLKVWRKDDPSHTLYFYDYDCWLWFPPPGDGAPAFFGEGTNCWPVK